MCCVQTIEAKLTLPSGGQFGTIVKTAFGPCKCDRKFSLTCHMSESEKVQFDVEVLVSSSEFLVREHNFCKYFYFLIFSTKKQTFTFSARNWMDPNRTYLGK